MSRIKMFGCIPRRKDVSKEFFHDHWRHPHGTLGRRISTMRGYVQSHQIDVDLLDSNQAQFEGCAEVWFDSISDALNVSSEPNFVRDIKPDEPLFVDMAELQFVLAEEEVICSGPDLRESFSGGDAAWRLENRATSIKLLQFVVTEGDTPWATDEDHLLGRRVGALRHVRCWPRFPEAPFAIGIRELWWPTMWDFKAGAAADPSAWNTLVHRPARAITMIASAEHFL